MAPIIRALASKRQVQLVLGHSGQHYDLEMSDIFMRQLDVPTPDFNINSGSGSHAQQTARIMIGCEKAIHQWGPDLVIAEGDTNTVVAVGLASIKLRVPFAHVEAGLRSFDRTMPEEVNRVLADHCAEICFAPTGISAANLVREAILPMRIAVTGNTIVDACVANLPRAEQLSRVQKQISVNTTEGNFYLVTAHRPETVDNPSTLHRFVSLLRKVKGLPLLYPVHPRSRTRLQHAGLWRRLRTQKNVVLLPPLGYWDFLWLLSRCRCVMTDSGGVQEEALTLGVRCITLRDNTERPETVISGYNTITGLRIDRVLSELAKIKDYQQPRLALSKNPIGDGHAGERIARALIARTREGICVEHTKFPIDGYGTRKLIAVPRLKHRPNLHSVVSIAYDAEGEPRLPHRIAKMKRGHVELFGEPSALKRYIGDKDRTGTG